MLRKGREDLAIKVDSQGRSHIDLATNTSIDTFTDFLVFVQECESNRITRPTIYNVSSSRSHTILEVTVNNKLARHSCLTLCDLAGSERLSEDHTADKSLVTENIGINQSLSTLSRYSSVNAA